MEAPHTLTHDHSNCTPPQTRTPNLTHLTNPSTCHNCGEPTNQPPPQPPTPLPSYLPIRLPAINLPPETAFRNQQSIILTPIPHPTPTPPLTPPYHFTPPSKFISSPSHLSHFISSPRSGQPFLGFIASLSYSVRSLKLSSPCHLSPVLNSILSALRTLSAFIDDIPPTAQSSRYGNASYKVWFDRMRSSAEDFNRDILGLAENCEEIEGAIVEIVPYFTDSFGNSSRIDYGTGHETNFAAWLYCLTRLGLIKEDDFPGVVIRVFVVYLDLMRKLQLVYCLEPAGSHGVWGLDDYHFLPFVFGSAQLIDHKYMKPKSIHNEDILENFSNEYMYLSCIQFIRKVKKGPFAEHSPLLDDISGVPNWTKVNGGLLKMYRAEVLEKLPVVQHFLFGSIIPWE